MTYILLTIYCLLFAYLTWRNFNFALAFLFFCLPTYLIRFNLGPLPTTLLEVMIGIITVIWLAKYHKNIMDHVTRITYQNKALFIAMALFLVAATISIFTSINLRAALGEWKAFYIEPVIIFFIIITTQPSNITIEQYNNRTIRPLFNRVILALILCGLVTSIFAIIQHFTGWLVPDAFWTNRDTFRVTAWYGFPNAVGLFLAPLIPLAIYLITKFKSSIFPDDNTGSRTLRRDNLQSSILILLSAIFIPASILGIYFAKSTGALVGLAAGLIFFLFFYNKKTRWIAIIISILGISSILGLSSLSGLRQEIFFQDRSGQLRINMWAETTEFLKVHPIAGTGLASYSQLIKPYRIDKRIEVFHHPHNIFLTMWVNLGLLGVFSFIWILVWFFRVGLSRNTYHITRNNKTIEQYNNITPFLLASMIIILVMGLVDSPYIKNDLAILFWLLPALLIVSEIKNPA